MSLYDGVDMTRVLYGEHARHVPAWLYVQDNGPGGVTFVGASNVTGTHRTDQAAGPHPLRYGSERTHHLIVGEIIVRPHLVIATDALRGMGLSALATHDHDIEAMLRDGEKLVGLGPFGSAGPER
jgi:hypothetical protein